MYFIGTDAVLSTCNKPYTRKPLVQPDGAIFEDGANLYRELLLTSLALPYPTCRKEAMFLSFTVRTGHTVGPAKASYILDTQAQNQKSNELLLLEFGALVLFQTLMDPQQVDTLIIAH